MIEIVICLIIWTWGLTPLWVNVIVTCLLFAVLSWKIVILISKFFELGKEKEE